MHWWDRTVLGNALPLWLLAGAIFLLMWSGLWSAKWVAVNRLRGWAQRTKTELDDFLLELIERTNTLFILIVAFVVASWTLALPDRVVLILHRVLAAAVLVQIALWGIRLIDFAITRAIRRQETATGGVEAAAALRTTLSAVRFAARVVLFTIVLLLILDNMGLDITALIAGLGVGGIAIALAIQNILGDLFASLSIVLDKPFVLGDYIVVGTEMGTVEKIGLKTTRIKSLSGEQIIFSNNDLLQSRVRNYKRMAERRVLFQFGVLYNTPPEKLREIPGMVRQIIESQQRVRFDRAHFQKFADSALQFEVVYYVQSPEYSVYAAIENEVNLQLLARFESIGVQFAYPTRTIHLYRGNGSNGDGEQEPPRHAFEPAQTERSEDGR